MAYEQAALVRNPRCLIEAHPAEAPSGPRFTANRAYEMAEPVRLHFRHFELVQPFVVNKPYETSDAPPQTLNIAGGARSESPPPVLPPRTVQADRADGVRTDARPPPGVYVDQADSIRTEARLPPRSVHGDRAGGVGTETRPPAKAHPPLEARLTPEEQPFSEPRPPPDACSFPEAQPPTETSPPPSPLQDNHSDKGVGRPAIVPRPLQGEETDDLDPRDSGTQEGPTRVRRGNCPAPEDKEEEAGIWGQMLRHLRSRPLLKCLAVMVVAMVILMMSAIILATLINATHSADSTPEATAPTINAFTHSSRRLPGNQDGLPMPTQGVAFGPYGRNDGESIHPSSTNNSDKTEIAGGGIDDDTIVFGGTGSEPGQFKGPNGVVASADGEIFVADMHNRRITVHNMNGTFLRHFPTSLPGSSWKRMNPHDVTMDTRVGYDRLWVVGRSWVADHVVQYSRTGSVLGGFTLNKTQSYRGIAFDARRGNILLSESREEQSCVLVTDPNGTVVHTLTHPDMNEPYGVTVDQAGRSFVSDVSADTVFVFNRYGNFLYNFGSYGVEDGQIMRPSGICTAGLGHIVVASSATVRLELFTSGGEFVRSLPAGGQMHSPDGVAVGPRGRLIVTDSTDDTVYIFPTHD